MLVEFLELGFPMRTLRTALRTLRQAWTAPAVAALMKLLGDIEDGVWDGSEDGGNTAASCPDSSPGAGPLRALV
jgi:hypothetical protein